MNEQEGLQFFVLDVSVILLAIFVIGLCVTVVWLYNSYRRQKKLYDALEQTVDRILGLEEAGEIDGRKVAQREKTGRQN